MLEPVVKTTQVQCSVDEAFKTFAKMDLWWPLDKRSMSLMQAGGPAQKLDVDAKLGGKIIETAIDGTLHHWGTFTKFGTDHIAFDFHMGLPANQTGQVDVRFTSIDSKQTQVELIHSNWEGYGEMAEMMQKGYGASWGMLLEDAYAGYANN